MPSLNDKMRRRNTSRSIPRSRDLPDFFERTSHQRQERHLRQTAPRKGYYHGWVSLRPAQGQWIVQILRGKDIEPIFATLVRGIYNLFLDCDDDVNVYLVDGLLCWQECSYDPWYQTEDKNARFLSIPVHGGWVYKELRSDRINVPFLNYKNWKLE